MVADEKKVEAMKQWPTPRTLKLLRGFLGLTGYNKRFMKHYGIINKPLINLLKKGAFKCNREAELAFHKLKEALSTILVLALADFSKAFILETDVCQSEIGAVMMKEGSPLAFLNKALSAKHMGLSTYEKELLAIIMDAQ